MLAADSGGAGRVESVAVTELDNALAGPRDVPEVAELHERVWDARTPPQ